MASDLGITHLILEMDSFLVVHMLQAKKGVEGLAWTLFSDILHLLRTFSEYHVQHTFREGNFAADYMVAIGQNFSHGITMFPEPPVELTGNGDLKGKGEDVNNEVKAELQGNEVRTDGKEENGGLENPKGVEEYGDDNNKEERQPDEETGIKLKEAKKKLLWMSKRKMN
ncbi:hypothetical protein SLEP1_g56469 [Rubroshorea leprosula]|uniref:RNase H type-1 domain-containing protein n=1 Tax=Rubroshorea leprosula TaxID=152421 RepID=A0AAV5MIE1_9ROSI|nr:hypothetical protein SLEP1_g56469 [Rubroshorea leprosula]